jgi:hypothetical protein
MKCVFERSSYRVAREKRVKSRKKTRSRFNQGRNSGRNETGNRPFERIMINLSSFIAFHARRTPDRAALKYRGEDISYAEAHA